MTKTFTRTPCKAVSLAKLKDFICDMCNEFSALEMSRISSKSVILNDKIGILNLSLETDDDYELQHLINYCHELFAYIKSEHDIEFIIQESPYINVDVDTYYDYTEVNITLSVRFEIIEWPLFSQYLLCLEQEKAEIAELQKQERAAKRAAAKQAKIDKEANERAMLAELKKKYPDA